MTIAPAANIAATCLSITPIRRPYRAIRWLNFPHTLELTSHRREMIAES